MNTDALLTDDTEDERSWQALPPEGGLFETTEVLQLHRLQNTLAALETKIQAETEALAQRQTERRDALKRGYEEGFEHGLAQWADAHQKLREQAEALIANTRQQAERCAQELLCTWLDDQFAQAPAPLIAHLADTLHRQLPTRPAVHIRYASRAETTAHKLHATLNARGWETHLLADERLHGGLIVDHRRGRILFDTKQLVQQALRAQENPTLEDTQNLNASLQDAQPTLPHSPTSLNETEV